MILGALLTVLALAGLAAAPDNEAAPRPPLELQLLQEDPGRLAKAARFLGDPFRGAALIHQPQLACVRCHAVSAGQAEGNLLGPDLTKLGESLTDAQLVDALLRPSQRLRPGFQTVLLELADGRVLTGLQGEERPGELVIKDVADSGRARVIPKAEIQRRIDLPTSIMPAGQINLLSSREEFLDLVRFVMDLRDGGTARAEALELPPWLRSPILPEYERDLDHARLLQSLDDQARRRGEGIYQRICSTCHGTPDQPGSLPAAPRFWEDKLEPKRGIDPYSIYQTLTHGQGLMPPQSQLLPRQKYDVIHYLREKYWKTGHPKRVIAINPEYLAKLPKGRSIGPENGSNEPWSEMNYGPNLTGTFEIGDDGANIARKGIAIRLDPGLGGISKGRVWAIFEHDTMRLAGVWTGSEFIDWNGVNFNGRHAIHPKVTGEVVLANPTGPGWANPADGSFSDPRPLGRDGQPYGPLPRSWSRYRGLYRHGSEIVLSHEVGDTTVLEQYGVLPDATTQPPSRPVVYRTLVLGPRRTPMVLQVATTPSGRFAITPGSEGRPTESLAVAGDMVAGVYNAPEGVQWQLESSAARLAIPPGDAPVKFMVWVGQAHEPSARAVLASQVRDQLERLVEQRPEKLDLARLTRAGPRLWPETFTTTVESSGSRAPFAVDVLTLPNTTPWPVQLRLTGFDFSADGRSVFVCSWDGDVWKVDGLDQLDGPRPRQLSWSRITSGLFQPLGLKIVDGVIHVTCRDQLVILRDSNGDGGIDFEECLNNDHQVTEHFHEFAMGLQTDAEGNFYYAKSARHALPAVVPQHGTLLKVSRDGQTTEIVANGFRAANGVCLNPDGTFFVTDQEGHWIPKNRLNWVRPGRFYGNFLGYHNLKDSSDAAMEPPVCWITNSFDRSPAEPLWVDSPRWGAMQSSLLVPSYGYGKVFVAPHERLGDTMQGGMAALPIFQFPTGIIRGRFHPLDGQLYLCGMFSWAGNQTTTGGFYRLKATGLPMDLPIGLSTLRDGMQIRFTDALDPTTAADASRFEVRAWALRRTSNYGSKHFDEKELSVARARLGEDGKTVHLTIPAIEPTWCMSIRYDLRGRDGRPVRGEIDNTIHLLDRGD